MPRLSKIGAAALAAFGWTSGSAVTASYLVVAGGSGGGVGSGGGGGAGGYQSGTTSLNPTLSYTITVGAGGASGTSSSGGGNGDGGSGSDSIFSTITSTAGGYGAGGQLSARNGGNGGSGGGGADTPSSGGTGNTPSTSPSQGSNGGAGSSGNGGGGGGASAVGTNASGGSGGNGGAGTASSISGSSVTYAGGGGGAGSSSGGTGGSGGGGVGGTGTGSAGNGTANLGGGGGGTRGSTVSGSGGSGIVIISYVGAQQFGGGVVTSSGGNTIHTFTTSGTLSPLSLLSASYLVVAGGGGGGGANGGGGAGGLLSGSGLIIDTNSIYTVSVGGGGTAASASNGGNGGNSSFSMVSTIAVGGGGGGYQGGTTTGANGGSGGGGAYSGSAAGGTGTVGQGTNGGSGAFVASEYGGGGGGGATSAGSNGTGSSGGNGGSGTASSISGSSVTYAGGGGGGSNTSSAGTGGAGGGGAGGINSGVGTAGTVNTGGGGGGGSNSGAAIASGGAGGSGIVIISYAGSTQLMAGGTVTVAGGNVIHTFTSSGYLTPIVLATNSLRFRASAQSYLNRTFGTPTNNKKWTYSVWIKRGSLAANRTIISSNVDGAEYWDMRFNTSDQIYIQNRVGSSNLLLANTTAVYRDPGAWYHIVFVFDSDNATAASRNLLYVNGVNVTLSANSGSGNASAWNVNSVQHNIGVSRTLNTSGGIWAEYDGYETEINFIDGQALEPNSFGTFNGLGIWQPIRYGGSYGTNGFYLPFTNTTSTTTLGYDFSPQGNNWTTNNISLTAGSTYDSMLDVPTLTSATQANYCVGNWLNQSDLDILREGNLYWKVDNERAVTGTLSMTTGKWYWEATISAIQNYIEIGIVGTNARFSGPNNFVPGSLSTGYGYRSNATKINNNTTASYGATYAATNVIGVAFDADNGTLTFYKDNVSQGTAYSSIPSNFYVAYDYGGPAGGTTGAYFNFGQRPFTYTPPTGFLALNTFNLATPTIGATPATQAINYMGATTYSGDNTSNRVITTGGGSDFVWIKRRNSTTNNILFDVLRGAGATLYSNLDIAEIANGGYYVQTFGNTSFTLGTGGDAADNITGGTYVAWNWKANGAGVSNTSGSITSTVSANTTAGFSIVTYTGVGGSGTTTVGHGLNVSPSMVIIKRRNSTADWATYHTGLTSTSYYLFLNSTAGQANYGSTFISPSSSTLTIDAGSSLLNTSTGTYVAYCFAEVAGYSAFGSYTGNGSSDGPFIFTGFRPRFLIIKCSSNATVWYVWDSSRDPYNFVCHELYPNTADAEYTNSAECDFLSNGFKMRSTFTDQNGSGRTYIYMAFAENPFKYANARQELICLLDKMKLDQMTGITG